jgi:hypothetical protein
VYQPAPGRWLAPGAREHPLHRGAVRERPGRGEGADPKSALDEDLVRLKSLLEEGRASAPGKRATPQELLGGAGPNGPVIPVVEAGGQGI